MEGNLRRWGLKGKRANVGRMAKRGRTASKEKRFLSFIAHQLPHSLINFSFMALPTTLWSFSMSSQCRRNSFLRHTTHIKFPSPFIVATIFMFAVVYESENYRTYSIPLHLWPYKLRPRQGKLTARHYHSILQRNCPFPYNIRRRKRSNFVLITE